MSRQRRTEAQEETEAQEPVEELVKEAAEAQEQMVYGPAEEPAEAQRPMGRSRSRSGGQGGGGGGGGGRGGGRASTGHNTQFKEQFTEPPEDNLKHHRLVWERTDVFTISNALQLDAVRRCPDHSLFDVLMSLFKRSVNVGQDGIEWIPVLLRPGRLRPGRTAPGLKGRIFSGIGRVPAQEAPAKKRKGKEGAVDSARAEFMKQLPPEIRKEIEMGVPDTLVGRSAFAFKKLVRHITRHRLGSVKLDIKNSFFQLLNRQKPLPPIMAEYLEAARGPPAQRG